MKIEFGKWHYNEYYTMYTFPLKVVASGEVFYYGIFFVSKGVRTKAHYKLEWYDEVYWSKDNIPEQVQPKYIKSKDLIYLIEYIFTDENWMRLWK